MADKTIALKIAIEGNKDLERLQGNFDKTRRQLNSLKDAEKNGRITSQQANAERAKLNVILKANRNALTDQQNALLKNNDALKKNSGFVAGVKKGVGQWATSMIGVSVAIAGVTKLVGGAINIIKDFEKANSQLRAVLGATDEQMKRLSTQAKELGSTTAFTASQVTELQTEFAKLGFPTEDIENMTGSTLDAAAALGSELGEQAALSGAVLKQYGLDSTEAARVNDVLAKSASTSALDFSKLSTALPIVGATAATAGVSLERTTALLGTLSDRGIDASSAGTSLRNIFLELSKKGISFEEAMKKINTSTDKNKTAMELFGKRSATAGVILAGTGESVNKLEQGLIGAEGAAKAMADTMLDNLAGDITKAESAWEGFILSLEDGEGALSNGVRNITQMGTAFLGLLTDINNGKGAFETFTNFFENTAVSMGIMNEEQTKTAVNLARNSDIVDELTRRFENQEITLQQYQQALKKVGDGWTQTKETVEANPITANVDVVIDGEEDTESSGGGLTQKQKDEIANKAKEKAKLLADLEAQEAKDVASEGDFDTELMTLIENKTREREELALLDEEWNEKEKQRREQASLDALNQEEKDLENTKRLEELKRDERQKTLSATSGFLTAIGGLMENGSNQQKVLLSAGASINTYAAAAAALAPPPVGAGPIAGPLVAGTAIASGLANVARINGVKFEDGGILNGASHANGGIPFTVAGKGGFEAEGGEAIINKKSTAMFAPLLSEINAAGGGTRFFANGGLTPSTTGVTASQQSLSSGMDMNAFADTIVNGFNAVEVINVASSTSDVAREVQNIQAQATF